MTRRPWVVGNRWDELDGVTPAQLPRVSVIVAHYDQPGELARTLHALRAQDYPRDLLEIVVADDGSLGEVEVPDGVILVRQDDRGFRLAAVRNLGVRASSGDVLCFLDADTAPEPGYVRALTRLPALLPEALTVGRRRHADFTGTAADAPVVDAAAGRELSEPSWLTDAYARSRDLLDADDRSYRFIIGAVMACSRRMFDEVGGFDESFDSYGGEDWEWAHRMWQAGAVLAHVPEAVAWHDGPEWAERGEAARGRANGQTLRLGVSIPVPGSAPRGLRPSAPDLVVRLDGVHDPAALFVTVDSLLAAFPAAQVVLDGEAAAAFDDPRVCAGERMPDVRVVWEVQRPMVVLDPRSIAAVVSALGSAETGVVEVHDDAGTALGVLRARRAVRRAARWGTTDAFRTERREIAGIHPVGVAPNVEAWVGGWGDRAHFA